MSFSVGFRAKSACHMLSGLADYLIDQDLGNELLTDPKRAVHQHQGHIDATDFARIRAQMQAVLDNDILMADFAGSFLSQTKCALDLQALDEPMDAETLVAELARQPLVRTGGLRCFYLDATVRKGVCYVDGTRHAFGAKAQSAVKALCDNDLLSARQLRSGLQVPTFVDALVAWVNAGYWYFVD